MVQTVISHSPRNLYDVYLIYQNHLLEIGKSNKLTQFKTSLIKYTLVGLGFPLQPKTRMSGEKIQSGFTFMKQVSLETLSRLKSIQERVFNELAQSVSGHVVRHNKCVLNKFLNWCQDQGWMNLKNIERPRLCIKGVSSHNERTTNKRKGKEYSLKTEQIGETLSKECEQFFTFMTATSYPRRRYEPIAFSTAEQIKIKLYAFLGWLHNIKGVPLSEIGLAVLKSKDNEGDDVINLIYEFLQWLQTERKVSIGTQNYFIRMFSWATKYLYRKEISSNSSDSPHVFIFEELNAESLNNSKRAKHEPSPIDIGKKWIDYPDLVRCTEDLKARCSDRYQSGAKRPLKGIAQSYQRYLMFAFLTYMPPDRQQVLRKLEIGRTLVKEDDKWWIKLGSKDYKTGKYYGERTLEVPSFLYPDIEKWLSDFRGAFNPQHNYFFTQTKGKPHSQTSFRGVFKKAAFSLTGKLLTPHLVRSIVITHLRNTGATDIEMESLALAMGHSREMQRKVYDRRTKQQKLAPAQNIMLKISGIAS